MRKHQLTTHDVETAAREVLAAAAEQGRAATVTRLAMHLGVQRQTLYRDFAPQLAEFLAADDQRRHQPGPLRSRNTSADAATIARLRREKENLTRHLGIYEEHIRRLTIENARLTEELAKFAGVVDIRPRLPPPTTPTQS